MEYECDSWPASTMTCTVNPRRLASISALPIGDDEKQYAETSIVVCAASIRLTISAVHPPFGEK